MIYDANDIDRSKIPRADICIIGAGAAGLAMADSLIEWSEKNNKIVIVLEASRHNDEGSIITPNHRCEDHDIQPLYDGVMVESDGITAAAREAKTSREFFLGSRIKAYGGTTNCWQGWTRPLDDIDFGSTDPIARWPSQVKQELVGLNRRDFYDRAMRYCSLENWPFAGAYTQPDYWPPIAKTYGNSDLARIDGLDTYGLRDEVVVQIGQYKNEPKDYGWSFQLRWGPAIANAKNVIVYRNANVRRMWVPSGNINYVVATTVKSGPVKGDDFNVSAKNFVLAASCIENVRLMLNSSPLVKSPNLGKYLMTHPLIEEVGSFRASPVPKAVRNFCSGTEIKNTDFPPAVMAMLTPTDTLIKTEKCGNFRTWLRFSGDGDSAWGTLNLCWELKPSEDNQITLDGQSKDRLFGDPLPRVNIALGDIDRRTRTVAIDNTTKMLKEKYKVDFYPTSIIPRVTGEHAMGGTRMADSMDHGVVDSDCKAFGSLNLYLAGGSVFPTGGWANPTLTILALALRLADHLKTKS